MEEKEEENKLNSEMQTPIYQQFREEIRPSKYLNIIIPC